MDAQLEDCMISEEEYRSIEDEIHKFTHSKLGREMLHWFYQKAGSELQCSASYFIMSFPFNKSHYIEITFLPDGTHSVKSCNVESVFGVAMQAPGAVH